MGSLGVTSFLKHKRNVITVERRIICFGKLKVSLKVKSDANSSGCTRYPQLMSGSSFGILIADIG